MIKHTSILVGIVCLLSLSVPANAIDDIKGVQPQNLASTLYGKSSGAGYQGTFFVKSPELMEIDNKMLKRAGVQYTLTQANTRSTLATYVTAETALEGTPYTSEMNTMDPNPVDTTSFSEVNHQVQQQQSNESENNSNMQKTGVLFSDVSGLLQ